MHRHLPLLIATLLLCGRVAAQPADPMSPSDNAALREFVERVPDQVADHFLIDLHLPQSQSLKDDKDLGTFVRSAMKHDEDEVVVLFPPNVHEAAFVVFFRKGVPVAFSRNEPPDTDLEAKRVSIDKPAPGHKTVWFIVPIELTADDGTPVKGHQIQRMPPR